MLDLLSAYWKAPIYVRTLDLQEIWSEHRAQGIPTSLQEILKAAPDAPSPRPSLKNAGNQARLMISVLKSLANGS